MFIWINGLGGQFFGIILNVTLATFFALKKKYKIEFYPVFKPELASFGEGKLSELIETLFNEEPKTSEPVTPVKTAETASPVQSANVSPSNITSVQVRVLKIRKMQTRK